MTLLVLGLSHRTTPFSFLEQISLDTDAAAKLAFDLCAPESSGESPISEAVVLSTCNRVEVYAEALRFHAAVQKIGTLLAQYAGVPDEQLRATAYVHYDERAVHHLFSLTCGLDSVAVGEAQILGQVRQSLAQAQSAGTVGPLLSAAFRAALHVGKRAHAETALDTAAPSLVDLGLDRAADILDLRDRPALVVGAGSMAAVAVGALQRAGVGAIDVANRNGEAAHRLLATLPVSSAGRAWELADLPEALARADLVVCCTGAPSAVIAAPVAAEAAARRGSDAQIYLDLALPRDVEDGCRELAAVHLIDLAQLADGRPAGGAVPAAELDAVRAMVAEEVSAFRGWERARAVAPTVSALRGRAEQVVEAELVRLHGRTPGMSEDHRDEVIRTVRRVVDKLLHPPTVRLRENAASGDGAYAEALRTLFDLDAATVATVSVADDAVSSISGLADARKDGR